LEFVAYQEHREIFQWPRHSIAASGPGYSKDPQHSCVRHGDISTNERFCCNLTGAFAREQRGRSSRDLVQLNRAKHGRSREY
jgi:hypothetical protein